VWLNVKDGWICRDRDREKENGEAAFLPADILFPVFKTVPKSWPTISGSKTPAVQKLGQNGSTMRSSRGARTHPQQERSKGGWLGKADGFN
jgi:hypothetical protein